MSFPHNHLTSGSAPDPNTHQALPAHDFPYQNVRAASTNTYAPATPASPSPSQGGLHTTTWGPSPPSVAHPFAPQPALHHRPGNLLDAYAPYVPDLDFQHRPAVWPTAGRAAPPLPRWSRASVQGGEVSAGVTAPATRPGLMGPPPVPVRGQERPRGAGTADRASPALNRLAAAVGARPDGASPRTGVAARLAPGVLQRRPAPERVSTPWYPCDWRTYMAGWGGWPSEDSVPEISVAGAGAGADLGGGDWGFGPQFGPYGAQRHHEPPAPSPWAVAGGGDAYLLGPDTQWGTPMMGSHVALWLGEPPVSERPLAGREGGLASGGLQGESGWLAHAGGSGERDAAARKAQSVLEGRINKSKRRRGVGKTAGPSRANVVRARRQERSAAEQVQRALPLPGPPQQPFFAQGQPSAGLTPPFAAQEQAFVDLTHSPEPAEPSPGGREHPTEQPQELLVQQEHMAEEQEQAVEEDEAWDVEFLRLLTEDNA